MLSQQLLAAGKARKHQCRHGNLIKVFFLGYIVRGTFTGSLAALLVKMAAKMMTKCKTWRPSFKTKTMYVEVISFFFKYMCNFVLNISIHKKKIIYYIICSYFNITNKLYFYIIMYRFI